VYKRDYTFRMNVMEEIFEIRNCIENVSKVDELKQRLVEVLDDLQQTIIDSAVSQWRQRLWECVRAHERHCDVMKISDR